MLTQKHLIEFVVGLKGIVPEPSRHVIARRLARLIGTILTNEPDRKHWYTVGMNQFVRHCELEGEYRWVDDELQIEATELAKFCNKWLQVSDYRTEGSEEWKPISPEQNGLRVTMVNELKAIASEKKVDKPSNG